MKVAADLHVHTYVTDGRLSPVEVIREAARVGLSAMVITDHSAVTWSVAVEEAVQAGVHLPFPGCEVSTVHGGRRYHVVLYGTDLLDSTVQDRLSGPLDRKNAVLGQVCDLLRRRGADLPPYDEILARGLSGRRPSAEKLMGSRTAIAAHLAAASGASEASAYEQVVRAHEEVSASLRAEDMYLPTLEVLGIARQEGVLASLAHPLWRCVDDRDVEVVVEDMREFHAHGLAATETRSYHHRRFDDHPVLLAARADLDLLACGGSDFHGNGKTRLGADGVTEEELDLLVARLALVQERRAVGL